MWSFEEDSETQMQPQTWLIPRLQPCIILNKEATDGLLSHRSCEITIQRNIKMRHHLPSLPVIITVASFRGPSCASTMLGIYQCCLSFNADTLTSLKIQSLHLSQQGTFIKKTNKQKNNKQIIKYKRENDIDSFQQFQSMGLISNIFSFPLACILIPDFL